MTQQSSVSSLPSAEWRYLRTGIGRTGRSLSESNFAKERRDWLAILLREALQNALDARVSKSQPVTVEIRRHQLNSADKQCVDGIIHKEHIERLWSSVPHIQRESEGIKECLIIEDFGTTGLTGKLDDPDLDAKGENWNAFWFREGEGGKEAGSGNGGAGQGKITYFSTSGIRTIFGYTVRNDDLKAAFLGASSFMRDYSFSGHKWKRDSYWGIWQGHDIDLLVLPVQTGKQLSNLLSSLSVKRAPNQPGLSLVIPSPKEFDPAMAIQIVIAEFFVPIFRGDLIVRIDQEQLDKASILAMADKLLSDERARELQTCTTKGYRSFVVDALKKSADGDLVVAKQLVSIGQLTEKLFDASELAHLRESLQNEKMISVRFPIAVKPKTGTQHQCHFDVHVVCPLEMDKTEQAVVRRDLLIGEEPIGGGKLRQHGRGLTLIVDEELSRLLLSAEEATHLRWNTKLPRLGEYYRSGADVVSVVRNALAKLIDILSEGEQKRDFRLLARYFSAPGSTNPSRAKGERKRDGKQPTIPGDIPKPQSKLLSIEATPDGCKVTPSKLGILAQARLPLTVVLEFAYEGLDRDAFSEYDPLDFDISDNSFALEITGVTIVDRRLNRLEFTVDQQEFLLTVSGFNRNMRLRMRLSYEEADDAAHINAE